MRLDEIDKKYPYKWNEKNIIDDYSEYKIAINSLSSPSYLTVWTQDNENIGHLELNSTIQDDKKWMSIGSVNVDSKHKRKGIATALYRAALKVLPKDYEGLYSYLPNAVSKNTHKIHKRLGGETVDSDHVFIRRNNLDEVR